MISNGTVEAAAAAMHGLTGAGPWAKLDERARDYRMLEARGALEAVAPRMLAVVYEEGWLAARAFYLSSGPPEGGLDANPYGQVR